MNVLKLRVQLETALVELLGVYTLGNGMRTPAISVRNPGERSPANTSVSGLEVIVIRTPDIEPVDSYTNRDGFRVWTVYLIDWANTGIASIAATRLLSQFPTTTITPVSVPEGLGPQAQTRLQIRTAPEGDEET